MATCDKCNEVLIEDLKWNDWLGLAQLLEFLRDEERITEATHEQAMNRLMRLKPFAQAVECVLFDEPPDEDSIERAVKRLKHEWIEEDESRDEQS